MKISKRIYLVLVISMLTLTESHGVQAQTSSGIDWNSICNTVSVALVQPCNAYVNQDGIFTQEGERAFGCIRNGVLMAGGAMALGLPTPIIIGGLRILASQTGYDNIVKWNLVNRNDLTTLQNLLPSSKRELELKWYLEIAIGLQKLVCQEILQHEGPSC